VKKKKQKFAYEEEKFGEKKRNWIKTEKFQETLSENSGKNERLTCWLMEDFRERREAESKCVE